MRIVITGSEGFFGKHMSSYFEKNGFDVWKIDINTKSKKSIAADITKTGKWQKKLKELKPDCILHLAGLTREDNPAILERVHCNGTENVLDTLKELQVHVIIASSVSVYGEMDNCDNLLNEERECNPIGNYAKSKLKQEEIALNFSRKYKKIKVCICRISNAIGPGQSKLFFIGHIVDSLIHLKSLENSSDKLILKTGSLEGSRDFIDIRDVGRVFMLLLLNNSKGVFNVASGCNTPLRDMVNICLKLTGVDAMIEQEVNLFKNNIQHQAFDISKISSIDNLIPLYTLEDTINSILRLNSKDL
jgi:nucleoside-diphosphate-sugar epimerase